MYIMKPVPVKVEVGAVLLLLTMNAIGLSAAWRVRWYVAVHGTTPATAAEPLSGGMQAKSVGVSSARPSNDPVVGEAVAAVMMPKEPRSRSESNGISRLWVMSTTLSIRPAVVPFQYTL